MRIKLITKVDIENLLYRVKSSYGEYSGYYHRHEPREEFVPLTHNMNYVEGGFYTLDDRYFDGRNQLLLDTGGTGKGDFRNAVLLYNAFEGQLSPLNANDPRLWIRLTHEHGHKYAVQRWMEGSREKKFETVRERFFFEGSSQAARMRNALARLWWIAHLTVDSEATDETERWRFTEAVCESQDFITSIFERSMGTYPELRFGILEYYLENKAAFSGNASRKIQLLTRELNNYGGVTLLPMLSRQQVKELCSSIIPTLPD